MAELLRKEQCPNCASEGNDKSKNNLAVYSDGGEYCFAGHGIIKRGTEYVGEEKEYELVGSEFNEEIHKELKEKSQYNPKGYRKLTEDTCKYFGVLHEFDSEGNILKQYYPATVKGELTGYKVRKEPKDFAAIGTTGKLCDLFGQFRFKNSNSKIVVITGGEIDQLSAYQMLRNYQKTRGNDEFEPVAVVSPTVGEGGASKQIQLQYDFFNRFEKIYLCFDNDDAGEKATQDCIKVLPKNKVYVVSMTLKDPNEYLKQGREREWISAYYAARKPTPAGVLGSNELYKKVIEHALVPKIPLPPFMRKLEDMTAGGFPLGYIINLGAASGVGKTSFVNELIYYWVFHSPHKIGVVSMELDAGQYGEVMLSRHIGRKIALIKSPEEKVDFLQSEVVERAAEELFEDEQGNPRWHLLDDRDGGLEAVKSVVEELIVSCGCLVIVLDPLQDLLDGLTNEDQAIFMRWQKQMVKSHRVTFININHVRKSGTGKEANSAGAFITEEDFAGSSSIFKSGGGNFLFMRNKYAEDLIERNTTKCVASKIRWTGMSGNAGEFYYCNETHTLYDKQEWVSKYESIVGEIDDEIVAPLNIETGGVKFNMPLEE